MIPRWSKSPRAIPRQTRAAGFSLRGASKVRKASLIRCVASIRARSFSTLFLVVGGCVASGNKPDAGRTAVVSPPRAARVPPAMTFSLCADGLPETGIWKCNPVFADFNEDALLDLAGIPRLGQTPQVWLGNGQGSWTDSSTGLRPGGNTCGGGLSAADVNNDGNLDLVVADHCNGVYVYLGNSAGSWEMVTRALHPQRPASGESNAEMYVGAEDVSAGDVDRDGFVDLVASSSDRGGIAVYLGDGSGRNWREMESDLPSGGWANSVVLADVNTDGLLDLLASHSSGPRVWLGDGEAGWTPASDGLPSPIVGGLYGGVAVGDINEDGRPDFATANWVDGPEVYLQQQDGTWQKTPDVFREMLGGAVGVDLGDIDRDGHLDMIVSGRLTRDVGYVYGVFALRGDGRGGWSYVAQSGLPETGLSFMWGIDLGDVNNDGILDVAVGSGGTVATVPGPTEPAIPVRMLVWCTVRRAE